MYKIRAYHIDCARHFFDIEELKKMARTAAHFGFNYFHWHLSDDQGYRLESRAFPLLCEISSFRKGDAFGYYYSEKVEGGFYTFAEVKDLIEYCLNFIIEFRI